MLLLFAAAWSAEPSAPVAVLDLAELTRAVVEANPEREIAQAALDRARANAAAAGPWPDPMVDFSVAPLTLTTMPGWQLSARQELPLWGTRRAARDMAKADSVAAAARLTMMQLELADMAAMAWMDWYTLHRELDLVAATVTVLDEVRASTLSRVSVGRASQLDALQAQAELGWLAAERGALAAERDVVAYRINALLHREATTRVPPPPATLQRPASPAEGGVRPEVAEMAAMTAAAEAEAKMARADRRPMVGVMAGWDAMEEMPEARLMAGVSVQVPLDQKSRVAAQQAAEAAIQAAQAEARRTAGELALSTATAQRRYQSQLEQLEILERDLLPLARARVTAARDAYATGSVDLRPLLEAERAGLDAEVRHEQGLALLCLRARELELARGLLLPRGPE